MAVVLNLATRNLRVGKTALALSRKGLWTMDAQLVVLDGDELDELDREDADPQDGPYSSQIELTMGNERADSHVPLVEYH
jgi:hypothetical protein